MHEDLDGNFLSYWPVFEMIFQIEELVQRDNMSRRLLRGKDHLKIFLNLYFR